MLLADGLEDCEDVLWDCHTDTAGDICIYTTASAHIIWDQVAATTAITTTNATRLVDTRT